MAAAGGRVLVPYLYGIGSTDPLTYVTVVAGTLALTVVAAWIPARRAGSAGTAGLLRSD